MCFKNNFTNWDVQSKDGNKDTDLLENGLEDMGRGRGEM